MIRRELHEENRLSWNAATNAHNSHKEAQATFFKEGGSTLYPEEMELLGQYRGPGRPSLAVQRRSGHIEPGRIGR